MKPRSELAEQIYKLERTHDGYRDAEVFDYNEREAIVAIGVTLLEVLLDIRDLLQQKTEAPQ